MVSRSSYHGPGVAAFARASISARSCSFIVSSSLHRGTIAAASRSPSGVVRREIRPPRSGAPTVVILVVPALGARLRLAFVLTEIKAGFQAAERLAAGVAHTV